MRKFEQYHPKFAPKNPPKWDRLEYKEFRLHAQNGGADCAFRYFEITPKKPNAHKILLLQEITGINQKLVDFASYLSEEGYHVYVPDLLGPAMANKSAVSNLVRLPCIRAEIYQLAKGRPTKPTEWVHAFISEIAKKDEQVGVIGMCLTGGFALTLMMHANVCAAVASQPSLNTVPRASVFASSARKVMAENAAYAAQDVIRQKGGALAMRSCFDPMSPPSAISGWKKLLGDDLAVHTFWGFRHSLLAGRRSLPAFRLVKNYLDEQFRSSQ